MLAHDGLISDTKLPVKILGNGDAPKGITIHAHAFSRTALDKLAAAGSTVQRLTWPDNAPVDPDAEAKAEEAAAQAHEGPQGEGPPRGDCAGRRRAGANRSPRPTRTSPRPKPLTRSEPAVEADAVASAEAGDGESDSESESKA